MAVSRKSFNFLPGIFQTPANQKFLDVTLDQLISEPNLRKIDGFIGRPFAPTYTRSENYIQEPTTERQYNQLEPSLVIQQEKKIQHVAGYTDFINKLDYYGALTDNHDRLTAQDQYNFNPRINLDKLINFTNYYWVPKGIDPVYLNQANIGSPSVVVFQRDNDTVKIQGLVGNYPDITVIRGQTYVINTAQGLGNIYIQSEPLISGYKKYAPSVSSRQVYGVSSNGQPIINFQVPVKTAQAAYINMPVIDDVDYALTETFTALDNAIWQFGVGMDSKLNGQQFYPDGAKVIFINNSLVSGDWRDRNLNILTTDQRTGIWKLEIIPYPGQPARIHLKAVRTVPANTRIPIKSGLKQGCEYFLNSSNMFQTVPNLTSQLDTLYYVNDYSGEYGKIKLYNEAQSQINVNDIIGKTNYVITGNIGLTNGLRIQFDQNTVPESYRNQQFQIAGVGQSIKLIPISQLKCLEIESKDSVSFDSMVFDNGLYDEQNFSGSSDCDYIVIAADSRDKNPWSRNNFWFHRDVIEQSLRNNDYPVSFKGLQQARRPIIEFDPDFQLFDYGRIFLHFVDYFYDAMIRLEISGKKIAINNIRLQIEGQKITDLRLYKLPINKNNHVIFNTDSDSDVRKTVYRIDIADQSVSGSADGVIIGTIEVSFGSVLVTGIGTEFLRQLQPGDSILTANYITLGKIENLLTNTSLVMESFGASTNQFQNCMFLRARVKLTAVATALDYDVIAVRSGTNRGKNFYYLNDGWQMGQQKTKVNQMPVFDIITRNDQSLSTFLHSDFKGTTLFSYKLSDTKFHDTVLDFPLNYTGKGLILGDLVFTNHYETDTFKYKLGFDFENRITEKISQGYLRKNHDRLNYSVFNQFDKVSLPTRQYQHFTEIYAGQTNIFNIGAAPLATDHLIPTLKVFVNNTQIKKNFGDEYEYQLINGRHTVTIRLDFLSSGDTVDILFYSLINSDNAIYAVPDVLNYNPENKNIKEVTFGQLRNHLQKIGENDKNIRGEIVGISDLRDRDSKNFLGTIRQYNSTMAFAMAFITDQKLNFVESCEYAKKEYRRFKNKFLERAAKYLGSNMDTSDIVDEIMSDLTINKRTVTDFPFFLSDMVPFDFNDVRISYHYVTHADHRTHALTTPFPSGLSNRAVLVYVNGRILYNRVNYVIGDTAIYLQDTVNLSKDDLLVIKEYLDTNGSYVPETPAKLGLAPVYIPEKIRDSSSENLTYFIQGHDGSLTLCFNDRRDEILLELETRIFNNIKIDHRVLPFNHINILPGRFRQSVYSYEEFNSVRNIEFLKWVVANNIDLAAKTFYKNSNEFTWNYQSSLDFDNRSVPGYFREIYQYFYDTDRPDSHPWEMLGFTIKPIWWNQYYSWTDTTKRSALIQAIKYGRTLEPYSPEYLTRTHALYARNKIEQCVPVSEFGRLLSPQQILIKFLDVYNLDKTFTPGTGSPAQTLYQKSSDYAFDLQKIFALLRPVEYFGTLINTHDAKLQIVNQNQIHVVTAGNNRINLENIEVHRELIDGKHTYAAGYLNWTVDWLHSLGFQGADTVRQLLNDMQFNLTYRLAGFTDKLYVSVIAEQLSLTSNSQSILIPDESYHVHLHKSVPLQVIVYSAVVIEPTASGYRVTGFDQRYPYFIIVPSDSQGNFVTEEIAGEEFFIFDQYKLEKLRVPYGHEFNTKQQVVDFLISYQRYLLAQGFVFETYDENLKAVRDWSLSAREFMTWSKQGWSQGDVIMLSPVIDVISVFNENTFVDYIDNAYNGSQILGSNFKPIQTTDLLISRVDKTTKIQTINGSTISFARLHLVEFENVMVFDNTTVFGDIIFDPSTGARQYRLKLQGSKTQLWDGDLTPPGFIYLMNTIEPWISGKDYKKGELVNYKNRNYTASKTLIGTDYFNSSDWLVTNSVFKSGLAPNFSHNAAKFIDIYDIDSVSVDEQLQEFAHALVGYRPRTYFDNLGLSKNTQIKFYQGYLKTKGTQNSILSIGKGYFDDVKDDIEIFEEWMARTGEYGAIDNNPSYALPIKTNKPLKNPLLFWFTENLYTSVSPSFEKISVKSFETVPDDYNSEIFLNRPEYQADRIWRIELFGDSIVCGKKLQTDDYSIQVLRRRKYSTVIQNNSNYSLAVVKKGTDEFVNCLHNTELFDIRISSQEPVEKLFVTIEPPALTDRQLLSKSNKNIETISQVFPGQKFDIFYTSVDSEENLFVNLDEVSVDEMPLSFTVRGDLYRPAKVVGGDEIIIASYSVDNSEELYYEFSNIDDDEKPLSKTSTMPSQTNTSVKVCVKDKVTGRVEMPPDFLLYNYLEKKFKVAITTRSAESSASIDLLQGSDGVNGVWPDNVQADLVLINHGLVDALNGVDIDTYKENLRELRRRLNRHCLIVWQTPGKIVTPTKYDPDTGSVIISNNDYFIVYDDDLQIRGSTGFEEIFIKPLARNISCDAFVNKINLPLGFDHYQYQRLNDRLLLFFDKELVISIQIPISRLGIFLITDQGTAKVIVKDQEIYIGSQLVSTINPEKIFFHSNDIDIEHKPTRRVGANNLRPYAQAMAEVAIEHNDFLADVYNYPGYLDYLDQDGIHLTQEGYLRINDDVIAPVIEQALTDLSKRFKIRYEDDLPHAGYVLDDEVDAKIFSMENLLNDSHHILSDLHTGYRIWTAVDFDRQWQVYRARQLNLQVTQARTDLDNKIVFSFDQVHDIVKDELIAVRNCDSLFDGFYQVLDIADTEIVVIGRKVITDINRDLDELSGEIFAFQALRFSSYHELLKFKPHRPWIGKIKYVNDSVSAYTDIVFVDSDINYRWAVMQVESTEIKYDTDIKENKFLSNIYSIVGIDCGRVNNLVFTANRGDSIQFCVTSVDDTETLYYTIETPTAEEAAAEFIYEYGERLETATVSQERSIEQHSFAVIRQADKIVDIESINNIYVYTAKDKRILETLDFYDPWKGRILSTVRQDIDYITESDPASYSKNRSDTELEFPKSVFWASAHTGSYWWNIRNFRYQFYEHSDIETRVKNWGAIFPGSEISVYEWINSDVLPDQHLAQNRDGIPLYANNEYYSQQIYVDPVTNIISHRYYFWVRTSVNKRNPLKTHSTSDCEILIKDPVKQNIPFVSVIRDDCMAVYNVSDYAAQQDCVLYFSAKRTLSQQIIHSEFKILQEFDRDSEFPQRVSEKLIDSIVGADKDGNLVPDPKLSRSGRLGMGIVPRQTLIEDFLDARRNLVDYVNNVLIKYPIRSRMIDNFTVISDNFFAKDPMPVQSVGNQVNETYFLVTDNFSVNHCVIKITDPEKIIKARNQLNNIQSLLHLQGHVLKGTVMYNNEYNFYFDSDSIDFYKDTDSEQNYTFQDLEAISVALPVTEVGKLIKPFKFKINTSYLVAEITESVLGTNLFKQKVGKKEQLFTESLADDPINILVETDASQDGKWSIYRRSGDLVKGFDLVLMKKQAYDVTQYWQYVDWFAPGYSAETLINHIINNYYELYTKTLNVNDIVYIAKNHDVRNRAEIVIKFLSLKNNFELYKVIEVLNGRFRLELVGLGNGTVQLSRKLYQPVGFDRNEFDANSHDVTTFTEMRYILQGLRDDIFVGDLKHEYNRMLFMIIEYILSKQKYIDWFFKTSFITVKKGTASLEQRSHILRDKDTSILQYIEEVKPYKTKIRQYIPKHTGLDTWLSGITDFDLPPYYDSTLNQFRSPSGEFPEIDNLLYQQEPYRQWYDNYQYRINSMLIASAGVGFTDSPTVEMYRRDTNTITQPNVSVIIDPVSSGIERVRVDLNLFDFTETPKVYFLGDGGSQNFETQKFDFTVVSLGYSAIYSAENFTKYLQTRRGFGLYAADSDANIDRYYERSLIKANVWTPGPGDALNFSQNGLISENQRVYDIDPWNQKSLVWEARPSGDGGADGGWNGTMFPIDRTKIYRSSVWIRRTSSSADGYFYHGLYTNGTHPSYNPTYVADGNVIRFRDGLGEWNPYWDYASTSSYVKDEWYLHVGHVFPAQYFADVVHPHSGIYNRTGKKLRANGGNIANDCKFPVNATMAMQRVYLFYSNNAAMRGQFAYPRWDLIDGTEPSVQDILDQGPYMSVLYNEPRRGYTLHRIRRIDGQVSFTKTYDLWYNPIGQDVKLHASAQLAKDLNESSADHVVVVHVYDEGKFGRLLNRLPEAMYRCGASQEVFGNTQSYKFRSAYVLVGIPGCGQGRGIENYAGELDNSPNAYAQVKFRISQGHLSQTGADPVRYLLSTSLILPTENVVKGETKQHGDITYKFDGKIWRNTKQITKFIKTKNTFLPAKLVPVLDNKQTRKIKTVVKFDRTGYVTRVMNWEPYRSYQPGDIISYLSQGYLVIGNLYPSISINHSNIQLIGTDVSVNSHRYRNSWFDNANDRIMALYTPSDFNGNVEKDITRLVPGVGRQHSRVAGNVEFSSDTILIGDALGSVQGIASGNIKVQGGKFIEALFAHSPEELLPGRVMDSLSIRILTQPSAATVTTTQAPCPEIYRVEPELTYVDVPYGYGTITTGGTFNVIMDCCSDANTYPVTVRVLNTDPLIRSRISQVKVIDNFTLLCGEQRVVQYTNVGYIANRKDWFDLSDQKNHHVFTALPSFMSIPGSKPFFRFNGINHQAVGPLTGASTVAQGANTVQIWIRWRGDQQGRLVSFGNGYGLWLKSSSPAFVGFSSGGSDLYGTRISQWLHKWVMITGIFYNDSINKNKFYYNTVPISLRQRSGVGVSATATTNFVICPDSDSLETDIGEIFVYNRELRPAEIKENYNRTVSRYPYYPPFVYPFTEPSLSSSFIEKYVPPPGELKFFNRSTRTIEYGIDGISDNRPSYEITIRRLYNLYAEHVSDINSHANWDTPGLPAGTTVSMITEKFNDATIWKVNVPNVNIPNPSFSSWRLCLPAAFETTYGSTRRLSFVVKMINGSISSLGLHNGGANQGHNPNHFSLISTAEINGPSEKFNWYRFEAEVSGSFPLGQCVGLAILNKNIEFLISEPQLLNANLSCAFLNSPVSSTVNLISPNFGKQTQHQHSMFLSSVLPLTIDVIHGSTVSAAEYFRYALCLHTVNDTTIHYHMTYRRMPVVFSGLTAFVDWADTESYPGRGTAYNFIDLTGGQAVTTTSTSTSTSTTSTSTTSTSTSTTTTTASPPLPYVNIGSQTAYGGAGYGGTANYKGGTSSGAGWHRGCNGAGGASPIGGNGPNYTSKANQEGSGGRGATGGGYNSAGVVAIDSPLPNFTGPTETAILNASGYGNGGGGIENNFGGWENIGINSGNGSGGLVRITIITGGVFTAADQTAFGATRIINGGKSIEWDNSAAVRSADDPWHNSMSGTFTMPGHASVIEVGIIAGGGGGSIGPCSNPGGGGGGAAIRTNWNVAPGTSFSIRVGAGGRGAITLANWTLANWTSSTNPSVTSPYRGGQTALFDDSGNKFMYATGGNVGTDNCSPAVIKYSNNADMPFILQDDIPGAPVTL